MSSSACIDRRRKAFWPPGATETPAARTAPSRSEEHTSELQSPCNLVCRLLLEKKKHQRLRVDPDQPLPLCGLVFVVGSLRPLTPLIAVCPLGSPPAAPPRYYRPPSQ